MNETVTLVSVIDTESIKQMVRKAYHAPPGNFVEVGVWKGGSAWYLARAARERGDTKLWLYDTFAGMPYSDQIDKHGVGDFSNTSLEAVRELIPEAIVTPGVFPASAVPMERIAFAHIDCDQYRAVRESVLYLRELMVPGGIMWLDDYECLPGARLAVDELYPRQVRFGGSKFYLEF